MKIGNVSIYGVIYKITNKKNGKIYIGQTKLGFKRRYRNDINRISNNYLRNSLIKNGFDSFDIVEVFDIAFSRLELDIKEKVWIKYYDSTNRAKGYNLTSGGNAPVFNEEVRIKMGNISKKRWMNSDYKVKVTQKLKNVCKSSEYRKNMSISLTTSEKHKRACNSIEFRNKQKLLKNELWKDKLYREKVVNGVNKSWTVERRKKASEKAIEQHKNLEFKKTISENFKSRWNNEIERKKLCDSMKKYYIVENIITKEKILLKGRVEVAKYLNISLSTVKRYLKIKSPYKKTYLIYSKED